MYPIIKDLSHQAKNIHWLEFELSNNCQYATEHKWCPRHQDKRELTFLSSSIIYKVIEFFKHHAFSGIIYLSGYSEPLIDPRLTDLVKYIKRQLPNSLILMFTNGIACDENLLNDVHAAGVDRIMLSVYNQKENRRLGKIANNVPCASLWPRLQMSNTGHDIDDRLNAYNENTKGIGGPCYMPSLYYFVRNNGDVNMCFWDWRYTQVFGNLYKDSVEATLMDENRLAINFQLVNDNRNVTPVCKACQLPHDRCTREYRKNLIL